MTKVFFGVTFETDSLPTWEKVMEPNALSQNQDKLIVFSARILSLVLEVCEVPITNTETALLSFPGNKEVIFSDIFIFPGSCSPEDCYKAARHQLAEAFWQYTVVMYCQEHRIPFERVIIEDCAESIAASFEDLFLPGSLRMEIDQLLPETTVRSNEHDWRANIIRLYAPERKRMGLPPK